MKEKDIKLDEYFKEFTGDYIQLRTFYTTSEKRDDLSSYKQIPSFNKTNPDDNLACPMGLGYSLRINIVKYNEDSYNKFDSLKDFYLYHYDNPEYLCIRDKHTIINNVREFRSVSRHAKADTCIHGKKFNTQLDEKYKQHEIIENLKFIEVDVDSDVAIYCATKLPNNKCNFFIKDNKLWTLKEPNVDMFVVKNINE